MIHILIENPENDKYLSDGLFSGDSTGNNRSKRAKGADSVVTLREIIWWMCLIAISVYFALGVISASFLGFVWFTYFTGFLLCLGAYAVLMRIASKEPTEKNRVGHFSSLLLLSAAMGVCGILLGNPWILVLSTVLLLSERHFCLVMGCYAVLFVFFLLYSGTAFASLMGIAPVAIGMMVSVDYLLSRFHREHKNLGFFSFFLTVSILLFSSIFLLFAAMGLLEPAARAFLTVKPK